MALQISAAAGMLKIQGDIFFIYEFNSIMLNFRGKLCVKVRALISSDRLIDQHTHRTVFRKLPRIV
jgi:hypothetical protein